jgi:5'-methylthioadenosine phosphorylase
MCYAGISLITDYDTGADGAEAVTMEAVFDMLARNVERTRELLFAAIPLIPATPSCSCHEAAAGGPLAPGAAPPAK